MLICTSVTIVYGGDNYITVRDVVNRLDKVAGSYNPQYTKEKLLSSSSFVLDEDVTKAQCYYLISRAFDNFPQLQGDCLANSPTKITYYDMPMWAGNEIGKMVSCGLVDNDAVVLFILCRMLLKRNLTPFFREFTDFMALTKRTIFILM